MEPVVRQGFTFSQFIYVSPSHIFIDTNTHINIDKSKGKRNSTSCVNDEILLRIRNSGSGKNIKRE